MFESWRSGVTKALTPLARALLRRGATPDMVTIAGTAGVVGVALGLFTTGHLLLGTLIITALVFFDLLDGTMARLAGRCSAWGAFLDSTLDRLADAAIFASLAVYFLRGDHFGLGRTLAFWGAVAAIACLALGAVVPYARARAESLGMRAHVGIAERADRLVAALVAAGLVGFGLPAVVLVIVLGLLALASAVTVVQRALAVHRQVMAPGPGEASGPDGEGEDPS